MVWADSPSRCVIGVSFLRIGCKSCMSGCNVKPESPRSLKNRNVLAIAVSKSQWLFFIQLVAVNDSEYHYEYEKKKKSFGRSKTSLDETLHTTNVGSAVIAGGNVTVNAALNKEDGSSALQDSRNVLLHGSTLQGGGDVIVGAGENILVTANTEEHLERHENKKSGFGGLTGKGRSDTQAQTVQIGSLVDAGNDAVLLSGNNLTVAGSTVAADNSVELHAGLINDTGDLNILALQDDSFSESKTHKKSFGLEIGSDFVSFSKEHDGSRDGTASTNAASVILAGNNITGNAAQDVNVVGSVLDAGNNLSLDAGRNVIITAGKNAESAGSEHNNPREVSGWMAPTTASASSPVMKPAATANHSTST